jgi:hypothetical protein
MIARTRFYQIYTIPVVFKTTYTNISGTTSFTSKCNDSTHSFLPNLHNTCGFLKLHIPTSREQLVLRQNVMIAHTRFYQIYTIHVVFKTTYTNLTGTTSLTSKCNDSTHSFLPNLHNTCGF